MGSTPLGGIGDVFIAIVHSAAHLLHIFGGR